jgi:hypothetical protein
MLTLLKSSFLVAYRLPLVQIELAVRALSGGEDVDSAVAVQIDTMNAVRVHIRFVIYMKGLCGKQSLFA